MSEQLSLLRNVSERATSGAEFSDDRCYRWRLWREWGTGPCIAWVMLNPSNANASDDDPTLKRCISFSRSWGFGHLEVVNLYSLVSSDTAALNKTADPIGDRNAEALEYVGRNAKRVVCAWGNHPMAKQRGAHVEQLLCGSFGKELWCLGLTLDGSPKHPLARGKHRIPDNAKPMRFVVSE